MFTSAPRFVAVDDNAHDLGAILATFQAIGTPCLGVQYNAEVDLKPEHFRGVRALFIDMHLLMGVLGTDDIKHFALIAQILEDNIAPAGGPFVLIVWTRHAHLVQSLIDYLNANLDEYKPYARPLAVLPLDKDKYMSVTSENLENAALLRTDVLGAIQTNQQLAALLAWESDVLAAAGETLAAILELVPTALRRTGLYQTALDEVLSRLAVAAAGKANVSSDKRAAINGVLAPILADRIQSQPATREESAFWDAAITQEKKKLPPLDAKCSSQVNRMLHIALKNAERIRPSDWGAVTQLPGGWSVDTEMKRRFGAPLRQILNCDFAISGQLQRDRCKVCLVRVGAPCDHAQGHSGPIPYLLAVEVPFNLKREEERKQKAEWSSPLIETDGEPFFLLAHSRYMITVPIGETVDWSVKYRLRPELLMQLVSYFSSYTGRPGMISIEWRPELVQAPPQDPVALKVEPVAGESPIAAAPLAGGVEVEPLASSQITAEPPAVEFPAAERLTITPLAIEEKTTVLTVELPLAEKKAPELPEVAPVADGAVSN